MANSAGAAERVNLIAEQLLKGAIAVNRGILPPKVKSVHELAGMTNDLQKTGELCRQLWNYNRNAGSGGAT